ncbi:hypothetical protein BUALT_Bualt04G0074400 [Buddleja alternifolia]|uniref:Uncharacterized protein n=1 Tax=Buddleja alternifolia TaxID=168488 RepID=A0AAV6XV80_9LAMI|nr:hypothetical protein BUALT_Bualt04G0074400 [Buddleja alternifolia]
MKSGPVLAQRYANQHDFFHDLRLLNLTSETPMIEDYVVDCEWKAQAGNVCVASFDWTCSGICKSVDRIKDADHRCGEVPCYLVVCFMRIGLLVLAVFSRFMRLHRYIV